MRVYLDNCCYNRPFDDQVQLRVRLETEAKLAIQRHMRMGILEYVWSDMLANEVDESKFWERKVLKKINHVGGMRVANPLEYIQEAMP